MTGRSLGHRAPLLWLVLPMIGGLVAGKTAGIEANAACLAGALIAATVAVVTAWRAPRHWPAPLLISMGLVGFARYGLERHRLPQWDSRPAREATLDLHLDRVFAAGDARRVAALATIVGSDAHLHELIGQRIYLSLGVRPHAATPVRSAVVSVIGLLTTLPRDPPLDTFDGYLAGAGINFRLGRGRLLKELAPPHPYFRFCAHASIWCKEILGIGIADKQPALAGVLRAMMLGETHELSEEQHALFLQSGTMHLFAISGLNIGVIATALESLLLLLRLPRSARFAIATSLLWLFVDITGTSPSAIRAFGMTAFFHAALLLRRPVNPLAAMIGSAAVILLFAPLQLFSASFLMSYGIVIALLLLGLPLVESLLARWAPWRDIPEVTWTRWQRWTAIGWRAIVTSLGIGVATTLVSLITSVQFFSLLTPGSLLANLVLIPAAMAATVGGFAAVLCGLIAFKPGIILCNHAAAVVLWFIESTLRVSVRLPGAFVPARFTAPWIGVTAFSLVMVALLAGYAQCWRPERGGWWPPFVIVALALMFGVKFG